MREQIAPGEFNQGAIELHGKAAILAHRRDLVEQVAGVVAGAGYVTLRVEVLLEKGNDVGR